MITSILNYSIKILATPPSWPHDAQPSSLNKHFKVVGTVLLAKNFFGFDFTTSQNPPNFCLAVRHGGVANFQIQALINSITIRSLLVHHDP